MNNYTIYCSEEQTKKALHLGAPIICIWNGFYEGDEKEVPYFREIRHGIEEKIKPPTAEQMLGWLKTQGFKFILSDIEDFEGKHWITIHNDKEVSHGTNIENKELAAIDAALDYLSDTK